VQLAARYDRLRAAHARGDEAGCLRAFHDVAGITAGPTDLSGDGPPGAPWLRYDRPRRVDLIALRAGARAVAKFEDLDRASSLALAGRLRAEGFRTERCGPYGRRFDVALSTAAAGGDRYLVVASRGTEASAVVEAERDRSAEGARRAGLLLGYPPCCVERFVALERSPEAERDGVNEAALRALLDGPPVPWLLHPLCTESPVGFVPCDGRCPRALALARRVFAAVAAEDPAGAAVARGKLRRPLLILRINVFWAFDGDGAGSARAGRVRYRGVVAQDDPTLPWLRACGARAVGAALARADTVALEADALEAWREGVSLARWTLATPMVPRWWLPAAE